MALFWAGILVLAGAGAATLQVLGPLPKAGSAEQAPPAASRAGHAVPAVHPPPAGPSPAPVAAPANGRIASPDPALLEPSRAFAPAMLPRVAADGRTSRQVYAARFDPADTRPRIGLVVAGIGPSEADSRAAIEALPGPVTLAFSAYSNSPEGLMDLARARGHEVLISIPMEAQGFPLYDAGSHSLLTGADPVANRRNLEWSLSRLQGYVGATGASDGMRGERFAEYPNNLGLVLDELGRRGLLYVDPRPGRAASLPGGVVGRGVDLVVDDPPARAEIEAKLAALERLARERGSALGLAGPLRPVTVERIAAWARGLEDRGIALAPISALSNGPPK